MTPRKKQWLQGLVDAGPDATKLLNYLTGSEPRPFSGIPAQSTSGADDHQPNADDVVAQFNASWEVCTAVSKGSTPNNDKLTEAMQALDNFREICLDIRSQELLPLRRAES